MPRREHKKRVGNKGEDGYTEGHSYSRGGSSHPSSKKGLRPAGKTINSNTRCVEPNPLCALSEIELWGCCYNEDSTTQILRNDEGIYGRIPPEIGGFSNLQYLELSGNNLSKAIPEEICDLTTLKSLHLDYNYLGYDTSDPNSGIVPFCIGNMPDLTQLTLNNNNLYGAIPSSIGNMSYINYLPLSHNGFTGGIPSSFVNLTDTLIDVRYNKLSGVIPPGLCNTSTSGPYVGYNNLCPPYPNCIDSDDQQSQDTSNCDSDTDYGYEDDMDQEYECQNSICPHWGGTFESDDWPGQCVCYDFVGNICNPAEGWDCWWEDIDFNPQDEYRCCCSGNFWNNHCYTGSMKRGGRVNPRRMKRGGRVRRR